MLGLAEVAAVKITFFAFYSVVAPLPDERADKSVVRVQYFPVVVKVAVAVAHRVRILAEHERTLFVFVVEILVEKCQFGVHTADYVDTVGVILGLIVHRPYIFVVYRLFVFGFYVVATLIEHRAVVAFVAERPHHDTRKVLVPLVEPHLAVVNAVVEKSAVGKFLPDNVIMCTAVTARAVTFDVGFVHNVKAEIVAELVKFGDIRVMRRSYRVDVALFHNFEVADNAVDRDRRARFGQKFVTVHAL